MRAPNEAQWARDTAIKRLSEAVMDIRRVHDLTPQECRIIELERDALSRVLDSQKVEA